MVEVQYLVFLHAESQTVLKAEAGRMGNCTLEVQSAPQNTTLRVRGFIQEPWVDSDAKDHLDLYISQDLIDELESEVIGAIGRVPAEQTQAVNPRWFSKGTKRLFYVFDRSEIEIERVVISLSPGNHGPARFEVEEARLFVCREVPQRGRGFRARVHIGVPGPFVRNVAQPSPGEDVIEIRMSTQQARRFGAAVQFVIDEHRSRNP